MQRMNQEKNSVAQQRAGEAVRVAGEAVRVAGEAVREHASEHDSAYPENTTSQPTPRSQVARQHEEHVHTGRVVKLDRGFPLVALLCDADNHTTLLRCKHATELVKQSSKRAVIGDYVRVACPQGIDKALLVEILPRTNELTRRDPAAQSSAQVLAANFDTLIIAHTLCHINTNRLMREVVLACQTYASVVVALTKADEAAGEREIQAACDRVQALVGDAARVVAVSSVSGLGVAHIKSMLAPSTTAVLIGKSGAGKSSLVNALVGEKVQQTAETRKRDGRGRHTTVAREIIPLENTACIIDMPGVRGLGMWEAEQGIGHAFRDVEQLARECKFSDCTHTGEPGCAVTRAVNAGVVSQQHVNAYVSLLRESRETHCETRAHKEHIQRTKQGRKSKKT